MGKSNGFDVWWMLTIWMCLGFRLGVIGAEIDARIDIVAILSEDEHFEIEATQRKLSEYFEIGETKAQMAVISEYDTAKSKMGVLLNFTTNRTVYLETLKNWNQSEPAVNTHRAKAFSIIRRILFVNRRLCAKAVIMMMTECSPTPATGAAMRLVNNTDVWLYVMVKNHRNPCAVTEAEQYTPDKKRLFVVNQTDNFTSAVVEVAIAMARDLCRQWEQGCVYYNDGNHTQCLLGNWLKHMNNVSLCKRSTPPPSGTNVTCTSAADCDKECDKRWPLERIPDCDEVCEANRITIIPPINMEYCAYTVRCSSCFATKWIVVGLVVLGILMLIGIIIGVVIMKRRAAADEATFRLPMPLKVTKASVPRKETSAVDRKTARRKKSTKSKKTQPAAE